jgi:hypothetical protein
LQGWLMPKRQLLALLAVTGCGGGLRADSSAELQATVDSLEERVIALESIVQTTADLAPGGSYDYVSTDIGQLTFSLDKIVASEDGLRATLTIGNTTAAELEDVEGKISWGPTEGSFSASRKLVLARRLPPGTWTAVTVLLDSTASGGVGAMRISDVNYGNIKLR